MSAVHDELYLPRRSPVHALAPEAKIVASFGFVAMVAITPRRAVWAFAVYATVVVVGYLVAKLGPVVMLRRMSVALPFMTAAAFVPFVAGGPTVEVAGVALATEGLWGSWNIVAKAGIGAATSGLLASTTPIPDIIRGLGRLGVPATITAIITFMFRYLEVIVGEMGRMRVAMTSRGHDPRWLWQAKPIASAAGALFIRSYERGERVHAAMLARGFTGRMPEMGRRRASASDWAAAIGLVVTAAAVAATAILGAR